MPSPNVTKFDCFHCAVSVDESCYPAPCRTSRSASGLKPGSNEHCLTAASRSGHDGDRAVGGALEPLQEGGTLNEPVRHHARRRRRTAEPATTAQGTAQPDRSTAGREIHRPDEKIREQRPTSGSQGRIGGEHWPFRLYAAGPKDAANHRLCPRRPLKLPSAGGARRRSRESVAPVP